MKFLACRICAFKILIDIATLLSEEVVPIYNINLNIVFCMCSVNAVKIGPGSLFNYCCDSAIHSTQGRFHHILGVRFKSYLCPDWLEDCGKLAGLF